MAAAAVTATATAVEIAMAGELAQRRGRFRQPSPAAMEQRPPLVFGSNRGLSYVPKVLMKRCQLIEGGMAVAVGSPPSNAGWKS